MWRQGGGREDRWLYVLVRGSLTFSVDFVNSNKRVKEEEHEPNSGSGPGALLHAATGPRTSRESWLATHTAAMALRERE